MAPKNTHFSTFGSLKNRVLNIVCRINIESKYIKEIFQQMNIKLTSIQESLYKVY